MVVPLWQAVVVSLAMLDGYQKVSKMSETWRYICDASGWWSEVDWEVGEAQYGGQHQRVVHDGVSRGPGGQSAFWVACDAGHETREAGLAFT